MLEAGKLLDGRYRLEQRIGAGGAGEVWRARHVTLDSIVAVKVLHVLSSHKEVARKRFLQEARLTAQLRIRQAVQVHDFGFVEERPFLVMELLEGETLKAMLAKKGRLPIRDTTIILRQAARALERAHALGIVHRDFKPDNVFVLLDEDGEPDVRVVDFGIAKLIGGFDEDQEESEGEVPSSDRDQLLHFTRTGGVLGTPYYMAPEQVQSNPNLGLEVDLWAFGVVAYECLTGHRPFGGDNAGLLFKAILESDHLPAHERVPDLPQGFAKWFRTACAPDPKRRFPDIRTAVGTLEDALGVLPVLGPSWLEATDPSISLRTLRNSLVKVTPDTTTSLSGTATAVKKPNRSRRRVLVAFLGALLLGASVVVGILVGKPDASSTRANPGVAADSEHGARPGKASDPLASAKEAEEAGATPHAGATTSAEPVPTEAAPPKRVSTPAQPTRHASPQKTAKPDVESKPDPPPAHPPDPPPTATKSQPPSPLSLPPLGL
jgi:serine/threonine-protein kinase